MVSVQASRFALLNVDDSDDSDTGKSTNKPVKQQTSQAAKKRKQKKKRAEQSAEADELRNLAFNKGNTSQKHKQSASANSKGDATAAQWEKWKELDEEFAEDHFEKDLQDALLASKVEHEHVVQTKKELAAQGIILNDDGKQRKKGKKDKKGKMTLEEFQKLEKSKLPKVKKNEDDSSDDEDNTQSIPSPPVTQISNPDPTFFANVDSDVKKVLQKEKIQEQYKKSYAAEFVRTQQFEDVIEQKDKEIEALKESNKNTQAELKQVKKRNQQLCHILSQGEMKDKTKILMELEELRSVRDELTEEVTNVTADLEKERSKVHHLQGELKTKGGKNMKQ